LSIPGRLREPFRGRSRGEGALFGIGVVTGRDRLNVRGEEIK
jgi:hypothetical protein